MNILKHLSRTAPMALLGIASATPAIAQEQPKPSGGVEDIVVTAQRREQNLQVVPVAVSALSADTLTANRITDVRSLDGMAPNLSVRQIVGGGSLPVYALRGEVTISSAPGTDRGVGYYIDGVFIGASSGSLFELSDIERIEVLRGPQGTLFGRNTTGGAISITTKEPAGEFHVKQDLTFGNYAQFVSKTTIDTPEWNGLSARLTYRKAKQDGDIKNIAAGTLWDYSGAFGNPAGTNTYRSVDRFGDEDLDGYALSVKWQPNDDLKVVYRYDNTTKDYTQPGTGTIYATPKLRQLFADQPNQAILTPISQDRPKAVNNRAVAPGYLEVWGHNLTASYQVNEALSFKNIASVRHTENFTWSSDILGQGGLVVPAGGTTSAGVANFGGTIYAVNNPIGLGGCIATAPNPVPSPPFPAGTTAASYCIAVNGTAFTAANAGKPFEILHTTIGTTKNNEFSEEFQTVYDIEPLTLTAGVMYYTNDAYINKPGIDGLAAVTGAFNLWNVDPTTGAIIVPAGPGTGTGGGRPTKIKTQSSAIYGQAEFHLTPDLDAIIGGRYTRDKKNGVDGATANNRSPATANAVQVIDYQAHRTTYNLGLTYRPSENLTTYAKVSTGYISGGGFSSFSYAPENVRSYEIGAKADWFDRRLRTNIALFDATYEGVQLTTSGSQIGRNELGQVNLSGWDSKARGLELETTFAPTSNWTFTANAGYTDYSVSNVNPALIYRFDATTGTYDLTKPTINLADGYIAPNRPKWTTNYSVQYESNPLFGDAFLLARFDASWRSKWGSYTSVPTDVAQYGQEEIDKFKSILQGRSYWLFNARVALQDIKIGGAEATVALWGRNLADAKNESYSPNVPLGSGNNLTGSLYEAARTYGIDLSIGF